MNKLEDYKLDNMTFNRGWVKKESLVFWGKTISFEIIMSARVNEKINDKQRESYTWFKNNIENISLESKEKVKEYIIGTKDEILPYLGVKDLPENTSDIVHPKSVLFLKNGIWGILCDCDWDEENGIVIFFNENKEMIISPEDILDCE
jgi:hypothetical protein